MYQFIDLQHEELSDSDIKENIFLKSEEFLKKANFIIFNDPIIYFEKKLNSDEVYYVIHDYVIHKGKLKILKGNIVISNKKYLIKYLNLIIQKDDIRPIRIMSKENPSFVITINDEGTALFFE